MNRFLFTCMEFDNYLRVAPKNDRERPTFTMPRPRDLMAPDIACVGTPVHRRSECMEASRLHRGYCLLDQAPNSCRKLATCYCASVHSLPFLIQPYSC